MSDVYDELIQWRASVVPFNREWNDLSGGEKAASTTADAVSDILSTAWRMDDAHRAALARILVMAAGHLTREHAA